MTVTHRAYSILTVKAVREDDRVITGLATTPTPDRMGDIVEPLGVKFKNPMPLLHQHRSDAPVGTVKFNKPTKDGVTFEARLPKIDEPGPLKDRVDTAWGEIKSGLVRAVSIGFRAIEHAMMDNGGIRFLQTEVLELSLVSVPANAEATIQTVKSIDTEQRAASGNAPSGEGAEGATAATAHSPGVAGNVVVKLAKPQEKTMAKPTAEQISAFQATRADTAAKMAAIMEKSGDEGRTLDTDEQVAYDELAAELKSVDDHLGRLRVLEAEQARTVKPVDNVKDTKSGSESRSPTTVSPVVKNRPTVKPGINLARLARVKALSRLDGESPRDIARSLYGEDSPVYGLIVKTAVAAGTTGSGNWAEDLVGDTTAVFADFVEFLRPQTILGKFGMNGVPSLRMVPFRVPLVGQTGGGDGYWVGEGKPKPLTAFDFSRTTLAPLKVANIAVVSDEVLRDSSPSAEMIVRDSLAAALRQRLDTDFIDPDKSASAGVSPASITNVPTPINSAGNTADDIREDVRALFNAFIAANNAPTSGVWIMAATTALSLSLLQNPLGQAEFPGIGMNGGTFMGLPVIVSEYVPSVTAGSYVMLVNAQDIYFADDGGIRVDMSREASLQMNDNPTTQDATTGTGTSLVSLWQTNTVGFLAERTVNWALRRSTAVQYLDQVLWGQPSGS